MTDLTCQKGEIGPFPVWADQNSASSCLPGPYPPWKDPSSEPERITCHFKDVCLEGHYEGDTLFTKHFAIKGQPVKDRSLFTPWDRENPKVTSGQFDVTLAGYTLESFIDLLSSIHAYRNIERLLVKHPIQMDVSTQEIANAGFSPPGYSFMFGMIKGLCHFAGDMNVIIHEFGHLLTFSNNREVGLDIDDIEGNAMHEAISDATDTMLNKDPEVGEGVAVCLGIGKKDSPTLGLRQVDITQLSLFHDEESHGRSELYAPFIWFTYIELTKLMKGDQDKAGELMLILTTNMAKFIPTRPRKLDFLKGFYNALTYVMNDSPDFKDKYEFNAAGFVNAMTGEASDRKIVENQSEIKLALTEYEKLQNQSIASKLRAFSTGGVTFSSKPLYENADIAFFQEYYNRIPVDGAGIRFVRVNDDEVRVVPMVVTRLNPNATKGEEDAEEILRSANTIEKFRGIVAPKIKHGEIREEDVKQIYDELNGLKDAALQKPEKVYLSGKTNLQYKFTLNNVICYIDSITGEASFHRQKFHAF